MSDDQAYFVVPVSTAQRDLIGISVAMQDAMNEMDVQGYSLVSINKVPTTGFGITDCGGFVLVGRRKSA